MTRSAATTFWRMPMPSAARTRARRGSTARILRTSRRMGSSGGWLNWRLRSGRRATGQSQSDECIYRRPTANSDRWASRACGIGSALTAALLVLEPIFEADLPSEIYAYRAARNAQQAVVGVEELVFRGHPDVVDADLADYFGSIPHGDLLKSVARRIVDRRVLHLIKMWLECPVEETDQRGRRRRTT